MERGEAFFTKNIFMLVFASYQFTLFVLSQIFFCYKNKDIIMLRNKNNTNFKFKDEIELELE